MTRNSESGSHSGETSTSSSACPPWGSTRTRASLLGVATEDDSASGCTAEELQHRTFAAVGGAARAAWRRTDQSSSLSRTCTGRTSRSIELARILLPVIERTAVLLVITQRDDRDHAAWALKEEAAREFPHLAHVSIALELTSLRRGTHAPARADRHRNTAPTSSRAGCWRPHDGNLLYLEEVVRSLVDAGRAGTKKMGRGWRLDHDGPDRHPRDSRQGDPGAC